ncbi:TPA: hypothetical protein HA273_01930 [Candidatus Bathyarchaeota archaeon]|nr:hypothetical protein [Candidatus Bathyarchaeota archaeon]
MRSRGDRAVPRPNKTAKINPSIGVAKAREYTRRAIKGGHNTRPRERPRKKARISIPLAGLLRLACPLFRLGLSHLLDLLFRIILAPIIIVTNPNAIEEYAWKGRRVVSLSSTLNNPLSAATAAPITA